MADSLGDLVVKIGANIDGFSEAVESIPDKFVSMLEEINPEIAGVVTAIVGIGGAAVAAAIEYEEAFNTIIAKTGATGSELDSLKESFETVFTSVPGSAQDIAGSLSLISDRLHVTGEDLDALTEQLAKLANVSGAQLVPLTDAVTKAFQNWNVATEDQQGKLDLLNSIAQKTGANVSDLASSMASIGNVARLSGESFEQTAEQIGMLSAKGVDAGDMFAAISRGMAQAQKAGIDLSTVTLPNLIYSIEQAIKAGNGINVAMDEFGAKAGPKMFGLVQSGLISSAQLMKTTLDAGTDSINKAYDATDTLGRQFTMLGKNLMAFIEPLGAWVVGGAKDFLSTINFFSGGFDALSIKTNASTAATAALAKSFADGKISLDAYNKGVQEANNHSVAAAAANMGLGITITGLSSGLVDVAAQEAAAKEHTALLTEATKALSEADSQHAENLKATYTPALYDLGTAQQMATNAREAAVQADQNLTQAEQNLRDLINSHTATNQQLKDAEDAVTLAKVASKVADEEYAEKEKTLTASKSDDAAITQVLKAANQAIAEAIRTDHVPATMSLVTAENNLVVAKQATQDAIQKELAAVQALSDFQNQTGFKDAATEKQLKDSVTTATANLTASRVKETQAIKDVDVVKQASSALDKDILSNTKLLDSYIKDNLLGTNKNLVDSLKDLNDAKQKQLDSWSALQMALSQENALRASGAVDTQAYKDAILAAQQASEQYRISTDAVNVAQSDLQKNFGLSKDATIVLGASTSGAAVSAGVLQAAYNVLGVSTSQSLQAAATAADAAFADILASGTASSTQLRQAQIADINAQIAAWTAEGQSVPASYQIMLAQLEQQENNYKSNSLTRWTTLSNSINSQFSGMWTGLTKDFFEGGDFLGTITTAMQHVGESILNTILKPFTDQIDTVLSKVLTSLTSKLSDWLTSALGSIIPGAGGALGTGVGAPTSVGGSAAGAAGSAAGGAASTAGSVAGGVASGVMSVLDPISAISNAVTAVASVLQLFGVGQEGQKDRLNIIANNTSFLAWAFDAGGLHTSILNIENEQKNFVESGFGGWYRQQQDWISDRVTDTETWTRTAKDILGDIRDTLNTSLATLQLMMAKSGPAGNVSALGSGSVVINVAGSVVGIQDLVNALSQQMGSALNLQGVLTT